MTLALTSEVLEDDIAVSLACVMAAANKRANELGVNVLESLISITQHIRNDKILWKINYGPQNYINQRGGDLVIDVNANNGSIERVLWGQ